MKRKSAEWLVLKGADISKNIFKCSRCGYLTETGKTDNQSELPSVCPNCRSEMKIKNKIKS